MEKKLEDENYRVKDFSIDPLLLTLSNVIDSTETISFGVTLLVQGNIVLGDLISKSKYISETNKLLSREVNGDLLSSMINTFDEQIAETDLQKHCVHLEKVVIRQSVPVRDVNLSLLRIPIGAIGGFSLGRYTA